MINKKITKENIIKEIVFLNVENIRRQMPESGIVPNKVINVLSDAFIL